MPRLEPGAVRAHDVEAAPDAGGGKWNDDLRPVRRESRGPVVSAREAGKPPLPEPSARMIQTSVAGAVAGKAIRLPSGDQRGRRRRQHLTPPFVRVSLFRPEPSGRTT